jgi:NADPH:quinone reductase-like Zn-dependent oxidoreductase
MKAIVVTELSGPDGLSVRDVPEPVPQNDEVVVEVEAVGVNFADALAAKGKYPGGPPAPFISGREFAGVVANSGERVMGYTQQGACAERVAVNKNMLWPQPSGWSSELSAAFPVNYFTAWLLYWKAGLVPGVEPIEAAPLLGRKARVLIHAAAGGVGTAAVQIGRQLGIETYGTASSDEKINRLRELGLDHAINYKEEDYEPRIAELTGGEGVDAVFDSLGGEHTAKSLRCCAFLGRVILFGNSSGERPKFDTMAMYSRSCSAHGLWLSKLSHNVPLMTQALESMGPWLESGAIRPVVGAVLPLSETAEAHRMLLERRNFGKVVLKVR